MKHIAFLRGINVSGQKLIKMSDLKVLFQSLGFLNVATYIQSGNVIFETSLTDSGSLAQSISEAIKNQYAFDVKVLLVTADEIRNYNAANPFNNDEQKATRFQHFVFFERTLESLLPDAIQTKMHPEELFVVTGKVGYLYLPLGSAETKMTNKLFESKLQTIATTRNWNTVQALIEMSK